MMDYDVKGHLNQILGTLPQGVRLVAISKYHPNEYIEAAYAEVGGREAYHRRDVQLYQWSV